MTDLTQALAEVKRDHAIGGQWLARDFTSKYAWSHQAACNFAAILNAAASGELVPVQCCMCGKTDLSVTEGDGGPECQFYDGRWTCSRECWDRATGELIPRADALAAQVQELQDDLSGWMSNTEDACKHGMKHQARAEAAEAKLARLVEELLEVLSEASIHAELCGSDRDVTDDDRRDTQNALDRIERVRRALEEVKL